ncbi:MAG: hypothetical protein U1D96_04040 [Eubacteriales bacterium]|nr:hypothetical protein [Bacillota bacterium]MBV1728576.1 hypothetical protein [Desulforudis sp.]MDQ7790033.1 hypothetical protein [Clostridia bacterium]MDZ4042646.1 hypothetical protein [Eubacteriales bacterium]MBU4533725.1 hypothetical protein [Bacillota bacterium]
MAFAEYGLILNPAAFRVLNEPAGVRLGYDRARRWIVMQALFGEEDQIKQQEGIPVRGRDGSFRVNGRDFARFVYRYHPELRPGNRAVRYLAWITEDDGLLVVDMNQPLDPARSGVGQTESADTDVPLWAQTTADLFQETTEIS